MEFKEYVVLRNKDTRMMTSNVIGIKEDGTRIDTGVSFERAMSDFSDIDPKKIKFEDVYL